VTGGAINASWDGATLSGTTQEPADSTGVYVYTVRAQAQLCYGQAAIPQQAMGPLLPHARFPIRSEIQLSQQPLLPGLGVTLGASKPTPLVIAPAPGGTVTFTGLASGGSATTYTSSTYWIQ